MPAASNTDSCTLLDLNVDCLRLLCKYLNAGDLLNFAEACHQDWLFDEVKTIDMLYFGKSLKPRDLWFYFPRMGQNVKQLYFHDVPDTPFHQYLAPIEIYLKNLEVLDLTQQDDYAITRLEMNKLKVLTLTASNVKSCETIAKKCPALENLNLALTGDFTGFDLEKIPNLKHLNLHMSSILPASFVSLCRAVKLQTLDIRGCYKLKLAEFKLMIETQTELEELSCDDMNLGEKNFGILANLPKLKRIRMDARNGNCSDALRELAKNRKDFIETLCIETDRTIRWQLLTQFRNLKKLECKYINDEYLNNIVKNCTKLERLNVSGSTEITNAGLIQAVRQLKTLNELNIKGCLQLDVKLINGILPVLKERKKRRKMIINATASGIGSGYKLTEQYLKNRNILDINFKIYNFDDFNQGL